MAAEFKGRVRVKVEDYGNSELATRFGVRRYPVRIKCASLPWTTLAQAFNGSG